MEEGVFMELLQLRYFQTVARYENMTRAAEELHIAQPSLSKTIGRLEEQVGTPLFDRRGKRIHLNDFGRVFLRHVDRSLHELEDGLREVTDLAGKERGSVTVGSATAKLLPNLIREYLVSDPGVKFRLFQVMQHSELQRQLLQGEIDVCISSLPLEQEDICCVPLIGEEIYLAAPKGHRLAGRKSVKLKEIEDDPLIYYTAECGLRELMNRFCEQANFTPNIAFECTTSEITCSLVEAELALAFVPEYLWGRENTARLVRIHLEEPECRRSIWLSWRKDRYLTGAVCRFREFVMQYFSRAGSEGGGL